MQNKVSPRIWNLLVLVSCFALLGFALYKQHADYLDPCPLCIFQRVAFLWMGWFALLAVLHNPGLIGQRIYAGLVVTGAVFGAAIASRQIWMQQLPADQVPECGPGLNYMLQNFPLMDALAAVFKGSGSCAEVKWTFLGLSMPMWTLAWFVGLGLVSVWMARRRVDHGA